MVSADGGRSTFRNFTETRRREEIAVARLQVESALRLFCLHLLGSDERYDLASGGEMAWEFAGLLHACVRHLENAERLAPSSTPSSVTPATCECGCGRPAQPPRGALGGHRRAEEF